MYLNGKGESMKFIILLIMLFLHIVDDYYLQGVLAKMKQKQFWQENAPDKLYRYDWIIALIEHAFSWTFMIMLPITYLTITKGTDYITVYKLVFVFNVVIHTIVDDLKCNKKKINLIIDQVIHVIQVIITWIVLIFFN